MIWCIVLLSSSVSAQFVTLARKIKSKRTTQSDFATVIIDAKTFRVYQAVIDTLTSNAKFKINQRNNAERLVEFTNGVNTVSMKIDSLAIDQCQITATAPHAETSQKPATNLAVNAIIAVCQKLGIKCTVDE